MNAPIVITGGDPAGIGPELVEELFPLMRGVAFPVLYLFTGGPRDLKGTELRAKESGLAVETCIPDDLPGLDPRRLRRDTLYLCDTGKDSLRDGSLLSRGEVRSGVPSVLTGHLSFLALRGAADYIERHGCRGLLTAPLSKEWVARSGVEGFHGHTDYLAERFQSRVLMLMHGRHFSVIPLTVHVPLRDVPQRLRDLMEDPRFMELLSQLYLYREFRDTLWALCSLNPHGGEGGLLGSEELDFMDRWADGAREAGLPLEGPFPADGLFMEPDRSRYRLFLSAYHDQGLIPFKALEGHDGVNCTVGLPFRRCSPDHGTAYAIAGKGVARSTSMKRSFQILLNGQGEGD